jgi:glycosyltransferase involved in cell wall biosynthesis
VSNPASIVSVVMPLHNKAPYIEAALESVRSQTGPDWEAWVVENHSTDGGPEIVREFAARDSRIHLVEAPPEVRGPGAARNLGIQMARGEWIQFLDADDLLLPGHFAEQSEAAKNSPRVGIISCDWIEAREFSDPDAEHKKPSNLPGRNDWQASAIAFTPWVVHAAWVRRSLVQDCYLWDESLDRGVMEDHVFWFKILTQTLAAYSPHEGVFYRVDTEFRRHDKSQIAKYLEGLDHAVRANLNFMKVQSLSLGFEERRALMNLYLGLLRFEFSAENLRWQSKIKNRIQEFRPKLQECLRHRDPVTAASFVLPAEWIHKLQVWRRKK